MPYLTIQFAANGPVLDVAVGVSGPRADALQKQGMAVPAGMMVRGLIDTGASCTCLDPEVIRQLQLTPTGTTSIITPSTGATPHVCNQYDASLTLLHADLSLVVRVLAVTESHLNHQGIHVLIGRDVLGNCLFVYDGRNHLFRDSCKTQKLAAKRHKSRKKRTTFHPLCASCVFLRPFCKRLFQLAF